MQPCRGEKLDLGLWRGKRMWPGPNLARWEEGGMAQSNKREEGMAKSYGRRGVARPQPGSTEEGLLD